MRTLVIHSTFNIPLQLGIIHTHPAQKKIIKMMVQTYINFVIHYSGTADRNKFSFKTVKIHTLDVTCDTHKFYFLG